jgi:FG-GAP repeat protein
VAAGDFNGDRKTDLVIANFTSGNVSRGVQR